VPNQPRLYSLHRLPAAVEARLGSIFAVDWNEADTDLSVDRLVEVVGRYDGLITTVTDPVPARVFDEATSRIRIVANFGVGVDLIDLGAAARRGVVVTNTPGVLTDCTADLTMSLILMTLRRAGEGERLIRAGRWTGWRPTQLLGRRVTGTTLGIIGMGRIGRAVAARARHGFQMSIRYASRRRLEPADEAALDARWVPLDDLLTEADVVSLHCPLTADTVGLLGRRRLGLMRRDAVLINTARGALVDEGALIEVLTEGRLRGAGLDVFRDEPKVDRRLWALENVVLLPHLGSATVETREAMGMLAADNLEAFFAGRAPPNRVA
jgi:lactate dehydrogenase-like 2-hydroxyacid dehydrogenase